LRLQVWTTVARCQSQWE